MSLNATPVHFHYLESVSLCLFFKKAGLKIMKLTIFFLQLICGQNNKQKQKKNATVAGSHVEKLQHQSSPGPHCIK